MSKLPDDTMLQRTHFNVKIAGLPAEINTVYPSSYFSCQDYLSSDSPLFIIRVSPEEIQTEVKKKSLYFYTMTGNGGFGDSNKIQKEINESRIERTIVHRKFVEEAIEYNTFFMHGAVVCIRNGNTVMFTAPSRTGKTTHIMKWINNVPGSYIVNGDKPLIKITEDNVIACGTPWCGKENYGINTMTPLQTIVLMERSETNQIEEISFGQAYPFLLKQTYLPDDASKAKKALKLLALLNGKIRFFRFRFNNFRDDCFDVAYEALEKNQL